MQDRRDMISKQCALGPYDSQGKKKTLGQSRKEENDPRFKTLIHDLF